MRSAKMSAVFGLGSLMLFLQPTVALSQGSVTVSQSERSEQVVADVESNVSALVSPIISEALSDALQDQDRQAGIGRLTELLDELDSSDNVELDLDNARIVFGATEILAGEVIDGDLVVLGGNTAVKGEVTGDIVAFGGDVRLFRGARVGGDVVSIDGTVTGSPSLVAGSVRSIDSEFDFPSPRQFARFELKPDVPAPVAVGGGLITLLGTLIAFSSIGFGVSFFAPQQLNIVAKRVAESPGKSFMAGLFAQPLILPLLAMVAVGLAVSIVGIILIPFAIMAAVIGIGAMALIGYLAVANTLGARHARQRAERLGRTANPSQFEAIVRGLIITMAVWLPAVSLSWVPVAGIPLAVIALLFTWAVATAGFGAVITTKAGMEGRLPWQRRRANIDTGTHSLTKY